MMKPTTAEGYNNEVTENCERVLVTLIRGLGPWRDSIFLVGGLTPRYLIDKKPPDVPAHAGTGDVDVVIQLHMLANTDAYHTLADNFKKLGFARGTNSAGKAVSWRWETRSNGTKVILELLADDPEKSGGKVVELPTDGNVSALNIPHSAIVFDHHKTREIKAELLGDNGVASVTLHYADLVAFTSLKAYAVDQRDERKDAHDLVYCLTHCEGGIDAAAKEFRAALDGKHKAVVSEVLGLLARHFADDGETEGYKKSGPVAVAKFELGEDSDRDSRILRQREVAELVMRLLKAIG
ncbi:antitoxin [Mesorhizobium sp.]|uniref:antitoxin n=1 Tax=Mesorhizobium sp. TaxID=1871066 RepID=UPI001204ACE3|nr:antitoxin [Mesorhizobium sp.]TIQ03835.1 MAG: antitoxin [Mesorhizobium sp.]